MAEPVRFLMKNRLQIHSSHTDSRPALVFITYTGIGDLLMALPLFGTLRSRFRVLPVVPSFHADLAGLLRQDGVLEGLVVAENGFRFDRSPLEYVLTCRALSRLLPDVALIYGKMTMAYAARLGLLRAGRVLFCYPRGVAPRATRTLEVLPSTGNQTRDYLQFAEQLGVARVPSRVRLSDELKDRLERAARPLVNWGSYAVVAPWTGDRRRAAPTGFFKECIRVIVTEGDLPVVVTGLSHHRSASSDLLCGLSGQRVRNLVGATTLQQLLGVLAGARLLLTNDGGTLHLARLVGTPAVVAFGPTAPEQRFLDSLPGLTPLRLGLSCSPCEDTPLRYKCPGAYLHCLRGLQASDARSALLAACQAATSHASASV